MADSVELYSGPSAIDQTGNLTIWWVPTISNLSAPTAVEIGATGAYRVTYSFVTGGWTLAGAQEKTMDDRLASPQSLEALGKSTATLDLTYVDSLTVGSAALVLLAGLSGYFVERRGVSQTTLILAAQKVRVIPVTLGKQIPGPVDGTGKFTITQATAVTGVVGLPVAVA
jgi:hypothetical protein